MLNATRFPLLSYLFLCAPIKNKDNGILIVLHTVAPHDLGLSRVHQGHRHGVLVSCQAPIFLFFEAPRLLAWAEPCSRFLSL